jgi:hypothetical protein
MELSGRLHVPAALSRRKIPWYPFDGRLGLNPAGEAITVINAKEGAYMAI